jgi:hypothetical protein
MAERSTWTPQSTQQWLAECERHGRCTLFFRLFAVSFSLCISARMCEGLVDRALPGGELTARAVKSVSYFAAAGELGFGVSGGL